MEAADLIVEARRLEEEKEQLLAQLDDADKAGLEAETLLQASSGKIETLEKARNAAVEVSQSFSNEHATFETDCCKCGAGMRHHISVWLLLCSFTQLRRAYHKGIPLICSCWPA